MFLNYVFLTQIKFYATDKGNRNRTESIPTGISFVLWPEWKETMLSKPAKNVKSE